MFPFPFFNLSPLGIILSLLVGYYWHSKGRSWLAGTALSLVITPFGGGIVGAILPAKQEQLEYRKSSMSRYKACPECHRLVKRTLSRCNACHYMFGSEMYEELRQRLLAIDDIRFTSLHQFGQQNPRLDAKLKAFQYQLLGLPNDVLDTARLYSAAQLEELFGEFPPRSEIEQATLAQAKMLVTSIECPSCHEIQSRDNLMCSECYTDLKRLNPDTGEVESIDVDWDDEQNDK